jgi:hypothetical protein
VILADVAVIDSERLTDACRIATRMARDDATARRPAGWRDGPDLGHDAAGRGPRYLSPRASIIKLQARKAVRLPADAESVPQSRGLNDDQPRAAALKDPPS